MLISTDIVSINQVNRFNRFPFVSRWRLKAESVDLVELKRIDPKHSIMTKEIDFSVFQGTGETFFGTKGMPLNGYCVSKKGNSQQLSET